MTRYTPLWEQAGSYAASVDRRLIGAIWPAPMVSGCAVTVAAGTMNMNIAAGTVVAPAANNTGSVLCYSDAVEVVTSPVAPAGGTNRYDVVVCQPRGNDLDGGANNDFVFSVVSGTASASPSVPATPAGAVAIAQVLVIGASASLSAGNLTDLRPRAGGIGTLAAVQGTALVAGASPSVALIITTTPLVIPAGRRIEITYTSYGQINGSTGALAFVELVRDSTVLNQYQIYIPASAQQIAYSFTYVDLPPGPSHTYLIRFGTTVANVGFDIASATQKRQMVVSDLGPAVQ